MEQHIKVCGLPTKTYLEVMKEFRQRVPDPVMIKEIELIAIVRY